MSAPTSPSDVAKHKRSLRIEPEHQGAARRRVLGLRGWPGYRRSLSATSATMYATPVIAPSWE